MNVEGLKPDTAVEDQALETLPPPTKRARLLGAWTIKTAAMLTASAAVLGLTEYQADINEVKSVLQNTHPYIIENSPAPYIPLNDSPIPHGAYESLDDTERTYATNLQQPDRLAVVNMPGFGLVDTFEAKKVFSPFATIGANWSVHYDNSGIDTNVIAKSIVQKAHDENIQQVGLYGDSMGTIIESQVAVEIHRLDPEIGIPFIIMDSPAVGLQVLRPKSRSDGYALLDGIKLPGAEYSRYARLAAELYVRWNNVHDLTSFENVFKEVHDEVFANPDLPANTLLAEQFQMIMSSNVEGNLIELGRLPAEERPMIVFMGAADAAADDVVNTPKSLKLLQKWTAEAKLTLIGPYGIENFYHGAQWRSMREYQRVLGQQVVPQIVSALGNDQSVNTKSPSD